VPRVAIALDGESSAPWPFDHNVDPVIADDLLHTHLAIAAGKDVSHDSTLKFALTFVEQTI
jgi:hypothetical protein